MSFRSIAIDGPIGVGKTALAERLAARLDGATILEDRENPFLAERPFAVSAQRCHCVMRHVLAWLRARCGVKFFPE